jgi:hypothetical protein
VKGTRGDTLPRGMMIDYSLEPTESDEEPKNKKRRKGGKSGERQKKKNDQFGGSSAGGMFSPRSEDENTQTKDDGVQPLNYIQPQPSKLIKVPLQYYTISLRVV